MSSSKTTSPKPPLPFKIRILLALSSVGLDASCRSNHTVNRSLSNMFEPKVPANSKPIDGVSSYDTQIDASRNLWFRLYKPHNVQNDTALPLLVYYHGGGFCLVSANTKHFDLLCRKFARDIPAVVISVNYRLAPEYKCPIPYEDGFEALKFIDSMDFQSILPVNVDLRRCFISGDSSGGNLAHNVIVKASEYNFRNINIIGLIALMPFFGGEERTDSEIRLKPPILKLEKADWFWKAFLPEGANRDHPAINIFGPNGVDLSGVKYPSTLVIVGGFDVLIDRQKNYCEGLKKLGVQVHMVEYPDMVHGFYAFSEFPERAMLVNEMKEFVQKQCMLLQVQEK